MHRFALVLAVVGLATCDRPPQPPDKTAPPEPQVAAPTLQATREPAVRVQDTLDAAAPPLPDVDRPNTRTIDVHVRRLRSKLEPFEDIVRTVRGIGYRFDRHADVSINYGTGRSPDMF